jgi:hypothetical protein
MINLKQKELSHWLVDQLKQRYPEVAFVRIQESVDDPDALWVRIAMPEDEDRQIELVEHSSELSADILDKYGYHITTMSASPDEVKEML